MCTRVIKRDGREEPFDISKIKKQIHFACINTSINPIEFEAKFNAFLPEVIKTSEIQKLLLQTAIKEISDQNPDWDLVAGRLAMWDIYGTVYKNTGIKFKNWMSLIEYLTEKGYYVPDVLIKLRKFGIKESDINYGSWKNIDMKHPDFNKITRQSLIEVERYLVKNINGVIEYPFVASIANAAILASDKEDFLEKYRMLSEEIISLATPFKRNLRLGGNVGSCFIGGTLDNLASITKSWQDISFTLKEGGGVGWDLTSLRPSNTYSPNIPKSNNIVNWQKILNDIAIAVDQAGVRKGAITVGLRWWHLDVQDFIEARVETKGDMRNKTFDIFPQPVVDNFFMERVKNKEYVYQFNHYYFKKLTGIDITTLQGEEYHKALQLAEDLCKEGKLTHYRKIKANNLFAKFLWHWIEIGSIYIANFDNLNKSNYLVNDEDESRRLNTPMSNLCVAPETKILTSDGYKVIKDLEDKEVEVWNGEEWSKVKVFKTGENQKLFRVTTNRGDLLCTEYHKFYVYDENGGIVEKRAADLNVLDKLIDFELPVIEGKEEFDIIDISETPIKSNGEFNIIGPLEVPGVNYTINSRVKWLNVVLEYNVLDSCIKRDKDRVTLSLTSANKDYMVDILLMLQTLGVNSTFNEIIDNSAYRVEITNNELIKLMRLGLRIDDLTIDEVPDTNDVITIVTNSVEYVRNDDTYCFTEPKRHMGMFNGILTGQCNESFSVVKPASKWIAVGENGTLKTIESDGMYHSCNLISINLVKCMDMSDEEYSKVLYHAVDMLDKSIDLSNYPTKEAENGSKRLRNIGIGFLGLADVMAYNKLMYDTEEGRRFGAKQAERLTYFAYKASVELAKKRGSYPWFKPTNYDKLLGEDPNKLNELSKNYTGNNYDWVQLQKDIKTYGIRNFLLTAIAPNTSTSLVMGVMPSYLPVFNKFYYETLAGLQVPVLPKFIKDRYWYYKTRTQYKVEDIIKFTRALQQWIDTGISMELNMNPNLSNIDTIADAIIEGFLAGDLKAVYYSTTLDKDGKSKDKKQECTDCAN